MASPFQIKPKGGLTINLGRNIRYLRQQQSLTQKAFACKLNVTEAAISRWENDVCYPDITLLPEIAAILQTSIDALLLKKHEAPRRD